METSEIKTKLNKEELNRLIFSKRDNVTQKPDGIYVENKDWLYNVTGLKSLIKEIGGVDAIDNKGERLLNWAVYKESTPFVKTLIELGADVNIKDIDSDSPLHWAVSVNDTETIKLLIDAGADVNAKNKWGDSPLHRAIGMDEDVQKIKLLIDAGADINLRDNSGKIPLYWAIIRSRLEVAEILIQAGSDLDAKTNSGHSLFDKTYSKEMKELLLKHGVTK